MHNWLLVQALHFTQMIYALLKQHSKVRVHIFGSDQE